MDTGQRGWVEDRGGWKEWVHDRADWCEVEGTMLEARDGVVQDGGDRHWTEERDTGWLLWATGLASGWRA